MSHYLWAMIACIGITLPLHVMSKFALLRRSRKAIKAVWLPALLYVVWDIVATHFHHWSFSRSHVFGSRIFGLPLEEYLFFIVIPYCVILTYEAVSTLAHTHKRLRVRWIVLAVSVYVGLGFLVQWIWKSSRTPDLEMRMFPWYSLATLVVAASIAWWVRASQETTFRLLDRNVVTAIGICLFFMVFVNGYLTRLDDPIVTYKALMGPRLFTDIPIEDFVYGTVLMVWVLLRYTRESVTE